MTNPLQTHFQTPNKLGVKPCANRIHTPCTHIPHTPYGFAPAFGGGVQPSIKISAVAPLTPSLCLGRQNASRVPTLGLDWKNLVFYLKTVCSTYCFAVADKNNCIVTIDRLHELIAFWQFDNLEHGLFTSLSCRPRSGHFVGTKRETVSAACAEIYGNKNKESFYAEKHTNKGTSDNPVVTGSSHRKFPLVTEDLLGGVDQICTQIRMPLKRFMIILTDSYPTMLIGDKHEFR